MNTQKLLLFGFLVFTELFVAGAETDLKSSQVVAHKEKRCNPLALIGKCALFGLAIMAPWLIHEGSSTHLDPSRPFTCAEITHYPYEGGPLIGFKAMCAHTQAPFNQIKYSSLPRDLGKECNWPHGPSAPVWALPGEIESLSWTKNPDGSPLHTYFSLKCRYYPR